MAKLTQKQVFEKLQAKGARAVCEVCGQNKWTVPDLDGAAGIVALSMQTTVSSGSVILGGESIPAVMNVCTNCGNVRFHAVGIIAPEVMRDV